VTIDDLDAETIPATDPTSAPLGQPPHRRRRARTALLSGALSVLLVAGGTSGWALNRYVIDHVQVGDVSAYAAAQGATVTTSDSANAVMSATTYDSDNADVTLTTVRTGSGDSTVTYYVADVQLTDATVLRSAFAADEFGSNIVEDTSDIAADNDAVFAVNGDYYGFRSTGIEIRNGVVYRDEGAREGLALYRDGTARVYDETTTTAAELVAGGVWNTLSFGPALVVDGTVQTDLDEVQIDTNVGNHGPIDADNPRTAVGVIDANHLAFVIVDGRSPGYSEGLSLTELAGVMKGLGATQAYNLDGGGSSTMVFGGSVVNDPLGTGDERGTSDILYIGG